MSFHGLIAQLILTLDSNVVCMYHSLFSIHLMKDIMVAFKFGSLCIKLLQISKYWFLYGYKSLIYVGTYWEVQFQDPVERAHLVF